MNWADIQDDDIIDFGGRGAGRQNWADVQDDEADLGAGGVSSSDVKDGIKTTTTYEDRNGRGFKIINTIRVKTVVKSSNAFVEARKKWKNFGRCHMAEYAGDYGSNSAVRAEEDVQLEMNKEKTMRQIGKVDVQLEMNKEKAMRQIGEDEKFFESSVVLCENLQKQSLAKRYDANKMREQMLAQEALQQAEANAGRGGPAQGGLAGLMSKMGDSKYTPPGAYGKGMGRDQDRANQPTIRVGNLGEGVRAGDLQLLFSLNGKHQIRPFLVKHKEGEKEGMCKGFAYITYQDHAGAQEVIDKLDGHGYDQRVLNVDWAKPREN